MFGLCKETIHYILIWDFFFFFTALNDIPHSPPPLPAEKPIGNTSDITAGKPTSGDLVKKLVS